MIAELDRYHGVVLRQILLGCPGLVKIGAADVAGRVDCFELEGSAFQIKHSSKRLSPWRFTYLPENLAELASLQRSFRHAWVFFVCGVDGVVGISATEFQSIVQLGEGGAAWLRVSRSRNAMYRVGGVLGDLPHAKARGVQPFIEQVFGKTDTISVS